MALHGDIMVSGTVIGGWSARRLEQVAGTTDDPVYEYKITAELNDEREQTIIQHRHSNGSVILAVSALLTLLDDGEVTDE